MPSATWTVHAIQHVSVFCNATAKPRSEQVYSHFASVRGMGTLTAYLKDTAVLKMCPFMRQQCYNNCSHSTTTDGASEVCICRQPNSCVNSMQLFFKIHVLNTCHERATDGHVSAHLYTCNSADATPMHPSEPNVLFQNGESESDNYDYICACCAAGKTASRMCCRS